MKFKQSTLGQTFVRSVLLCCAFVFVLMTTSARAGYLYALNHNETGNTIYGYSLNETTGSLAALPNFPIATGGIGSAGGTSELVTIDQLNKRVYVVNSGSRTVNSYSINTATGALTPLFSPISFPPGSFLETIAIHPSGSPLVVGDGVYGLLYSFMITPTAVFATVGNPYSTNSANAGSSVFSQDGTYFYTGDRFASNFFAGYSVNAVTGILTRLPGSPFNSGAITPQSFAMDAQGRLFLANSFVGQVRAFQTLNGIPASASGNPFPSGGGGSLDGVLHPNGNFYVISNHINGIGYCINSYQIGGAGTSTTLTQVAGSPLNSGGTSINTIVFNEAGTLLFTANGTSRNISTFNFNTTTGELTLNNIQANNTNGATGYLTGVSYLPGTPDADGDGVSDATDNCLMTANADQLDTDTDGQGNACDTDDDGDGVPDAQDAFPLDPNESVDTDSDGTGNNTDTDDDNDGVTDTSDNCPLIANPNQADFDLDGIGDTCDPKTGPPKNKEQCKNNGWMRFDTPRRFKSQGDCIQFFNIGN